MRSVRRNPARLGALAACGALLGAGAIGCATTQEKAARAQAQAAHVLKARAERQHKRKQTRHEQKGKGSAHE